MKFKKRKDLSPVNESCLKQCQYCKIQVKMDEMWSYYQDKKHQVWLWWVINHETSDVIAYWFGTREHKHWDKLLELLSLFVMAKIYTDGNDAYYERFDGVGRIEEEYAENGA